MFTLENEVLKVQVSAKGAELQSIINKVFQTDYLWNGNPAFWAKHSPVLFPIVGALKNDTYYFNDIAWQLERHGFARDTEFLLTSNSGNRMVFTLEANTETLLKYPFAFRFDISYELS